MEHLADGGGVSGSDGVAETDFVAAHLKEGLCYATHADGVDMTRVGAVDDHAHIAASLLGDEVTRGR